jgi:hypothetical protein
MRIKYIAIILLLMTAPAFAQTGTSQTPAQLNNEINSKFTDQLIGAITPYTLRQLTLDMVASTGQIFNITGFGAVCDGTTDDYTAIQNAINKAQSTSVTSGGLPFGTPVIQFPGAICRIASALNITGPLVFDGGGSGNAVLLVDNATGGLVFSPSSQYNQSVVKNLTIKAGRTHAGTAFKYNGVVTSSANNPQLLLENVLIRGDGTNYFDRGIYFDNAWDAVFNHVTLLADGASSATYWSNAIEIGTNVIDAKFSQVSINGAVHAWNITGAHVEGIRIEHSTAIAVNFGVVGTTSVGSPHFTVLDSHISAATTNVSLSGSFAQVIIGRNDFFLQSQAGFTTPNGAKAIDCLACGAVTISGNILAMNDVAATGTVGIKYDTGTSDVNDGGNTLAGFATGVSVVSGVTGTYAASTFDTVTTPISNSAPSTFFSSNQTISWGGAGGTSFLKWIDTVANKTTNWNYNAGVVSWIRNDGTTTGASLDVEHSVLSLGGSGVLGSLSLGNATSGTITLQPVGGALGNVTPSLPANTGIIAETNYAQSWTGLQSFASIGLVTLGWSSTAPTIASGFCSTGSPVTALSASNGTAAFDILIGAATCGSTGTLTMPTATTGWVCSATDVTTPASHNVVQTGTNGSTTAVVLTDYSRTAGTAQNFLPADHVHVMCTAY